MKIKMNHRLKVFLAFLLACTLVITSISPHVVDATTTSGSAVSKVDNLTEDLISTDESNESTESDAVSSSENDVPSKSVVLNFDELKGKLSCNTDADDDLGFTAVIMREEDFPKDCVGNVGILNDDGSAIQSLRETLQKNVIIKLPLDISVVNGVQDVCENLGEVTIKVSFDKGDINDIKNSSLYHQLSDGSWEHLQYEIVEETDEEPAYVVFSTESFSPFLFVTNEDGSAVVDDDVDKNTEETTTKETPEDETATDENLKSVATEDENSENSSESSDETGDDAASSVEPIEINEFNIRHVSGATLDDEGRYVWTPSNPSDVHTFVFRAEYSLSGVFATKKGAFCLELPLHIFKSADGGYADVFDCAYVLESELSAGDSPNFVYNIDAARNVVTITNYTTNVTGEAGYIEFSYTTTTNTGGYLDMEPSLGVTGTLYATNEAKTVSATTSAEPIYIDTHARIVSTTKKTPSYYGTWQDNWCAKPSDADDYLYLVWEIESNVVNTGTSYEFTLDDTFSDLDGSVVGYRFAEQNSFSDENHITSSLSGRRYDYVLTRHSKEKAEELVNQFGKYSVSNTITATVLSNDGETTARASRDWEYVLPKYIPPTSHTWLGKDGCTKDYSLIEFLDGEQDSIDFLYLINGGAYPYPYTLSDDATDTVDDALNGLYGQKKVDYTLIDDSVYLNDSSEPLADDNYDMKSVTWSYIFKDAVFDTDTLSFKGVLLSRYKAEDAVSIYVRTEAGWNLATVYDLSTKTYRNVDRNYISRISSDNSTITFNDGVKGIKFTCSNAYFYTNLNVRPVVSLKRTEDVINIIGDTSVVPIRNCAQFSITQDNNVIYTDEWSGVDYTRGVVKSSNVDKSVAGTNNDKKNRIFSVTWNVDAYERYQDNSGYNYIEQEGGCFYDLLPAGGELDKKSIAVSAGGQTLSDSAYEITTIPNYKNSGRMLLKVNIKGATNSKYSLSYMTNHSYDSIRDYGKNLLNSVAYETGNEKITDGYEDNGGTITDKDILSNLDESESGNKFLYSEARYTISILMATNTGLQKLVKSDEDSIYGYSSIVYDDSGYAYRIRLANDASTEAKNIVFFDSLENFYQGQNDTEPKLKSDWKGELTDIDLSNFSQYNVNAVVYLSKIDDMNIWQHHNLKEVTADGERVWLPYDEFKNEYGLSEARAIAVDASEMEDGTDFVLGENQSVSFTVYMKSPKSDDTGVADPQTYNNVFVSRSLLVKNDNGEVNEVDHFFHHDYTSLHYRIACNMSFMKVDATDGKTPVADAKYVFRGTSQYGTVYDEEKVTGSDGTFSLANIEPGTYEFFETECTNDWLLDKNIYTIVVSGDGQVHVDGLDVSEDNVVTLQDEPRIHADVVFRKIDSVTKNNVNGVKFRLSGTSDYGNDILMYATSSGVNGQVLFLDVELGTYELTETEVPDTHIDKNKVWTVRVDERGVAVIYEGNKEVSKSLAGYYQVENEPYHSVRFVKSSSYGDNVYLEGAEFELKGISDYGNEYAETAVSASADNGGLVIFDKLEPGVYQLKETKAPDGHDLSLLSYRVTVKEDGTFTIDGLDKVQFGSNANNLVYNFIDAKTEGTVVVTKQWEDIKSNDERVIPDITIDTRKPSKNALGYGITFDANGGTFSDGSTSNEIIYNSSGNIVTGKYEVPTSDTGFIGWCTDKECTNAYSIPDDGVLESGITEDIVLYARYQTYMLKTGSDFYNSIPIETTSVLFTDEVAPEDASLIDLDADGDGCVVGWLDGTTLKVSTQEKGIDVVANTDSSRMFYRTDTDCYNSRRNITSINLNNLDTSKVENASYMFGCYDYGYGRLTSIVGLNTIDTSNMTNMSYMFCGSRLSGIDVSNFDTSNVTTMRGMFEYCYNLTNLDLSSFDTSNVTDMAYMFCMNTSYNNSLKSLDLSSFDTSNVTSMSYMFQNCYRLTSLDLSSFDTSNVTNMSSMFYHCYGLKSLDLSNFDTSSVTSMSSMFYDCYNLTSLDLSNFDTSNVTSMSYMFYDCYNLTSLDLSNFDTSNVTSMSYMFSGCTNLTSLDLSNFDTSSVTSMSLMFYNCDGFTTIDLSSFDTSKVTNMSYMFQSCSGLTSLDLSNFDTSNVTDMSWMFSNCTNLTSLDLSSFDTSNVTNMEGMFSNCGALTNLDLSILDSSNVTDMSSMFSHYNGSAELDLSKLDTSSVTDMSYMFEYYQSATELDLSKLNTSNVTNMTGMFQYYNSQATLDLSKLNTPKVTNMSSMFYRCYTPDSIDLSGLDTSNVTNMSSMFACYDNDYNIGFVTLDLSGFDTSKVTNMSYMFKNAYNLTSLDLSGWDTSKVTNMSYMFYMYNTGYSKMTALDLTELETSNVTYMSYMFRNYNSLTSLDLSSFDTSKVKDMGYMFLNCYGLTSLDLSSFDTSSVTSMYQMFYNCSGLTELDLSSFDTSSVTSMYQMFYNCDGLASLDLSSFNTSKVTNMYQMFGSYGGTASLDLSSFTISSSTNIQCMFSSYHSPTELDLSKLDTSSVTDMRHMFSYYNSQATLDLSKLDTSKVTNMSYMFYRCHTPDSIDLSGLDTSNVTNMSYMFACDSSDYNIGFVTLDLSGFDTSKVTNMSYMFKNAYNLTSLDLSGWDTSKVTDMSYMFYMYNTGYSKMTSLDLTELETSNVTTMSYMFYCFSSLTSLDLSNFDTSKVTDMRYMFYNCYGLKSLDLSNFDTSKVTNMSWMFNNCTNLTSLDLSNFDTSNVTNMEGMFYRCYYLTELDLSSFDTSKVTNKSSMFYNCYRLAKVILGDKFTCASYLPTPSGSYISGADGKWYNSAGDGFTSSQIPSDTADTYYGSLSLVA